MRQQTEASHSCPLQKSMTVSQHLAPNKEIVFLNDNLHEDGETQLMPWNMFLNRSRGVTVNFSMNKSFNDITFHGLKGNIRYTNFENQK